MIKKNSLTKKLSPSTIKKIAQKNLTLLSEYGQ